MLSPRRFLSRRWLLAFLGSAALLFGLAMLHPYPRQSLFGPTIRGKPWCYWEDAVRQHVHTEEYKNTLAAKIMRWFGEDNDPAMAWDFWDHAEMLPLILQLADDDDPWVRRQSVIAIEVYPNLQKEIALSMLHNRLNDDDFEVRVWAARAIWQINKDEKALAFIVLAWNNSEQGARDGARSFFYITSIEDPEEFAKIACRTNASLKPMRQDTLKTHYFGFDQPRLTNLVRCLEDGNRGNRLQAVYGLEYLGAEAKVVLSSLEHCLKDEDRGVRIAAFDAVMSIEPERIPRLEAERKKE